MSARAKAALVAGVAAALLSTATDPLLAQETGLSKSALVQLVVSAQTDDQKLTTLRTRCLSFEPTDGDWRDLRNLGASEELIAAAQQCAREALAVRVAINASRTRHRAGDTTLVTVDLSRAGSAVDGQTLVLTGSGGPGNGTRYSRTTNAAGRAFFSLPAGEQLGATRYTVSVAGTDLMGATRVTLTTVPALPAAATVSPDSFRVGAGEVVPELEVLVQDRFGNAVARSDLELFGGTTATAPVLATATTDGDGRAVFEVVGEPPSEATVWEVRREETVLASVSVQVEPGGGPEAAAAAAAAAAAVVPVEAIDDVAVREGQASLEAGDPAAAEQSFRQALGVSPRRADAQMGLGAAMLAQGQEDEAITWYEVASRQSPDNADVWEGLGQAYAAAGRRDDASRAFERAYEIDPSREELPTEVADLGRPPGFVTGILWGGSTSGNSESGGIRRGTFDVSISPAVSLWGGWDRSLAPRSPELVRGPDEWDAWFAGGSLSYGSGHRLSTAIDFGQRTQSFSPVDDDASLKQNVYRLTQTIRFSEARRSTQLEIGGFLGRWFDDDDWIVFSRLKAPVGRRLSVVASGSYGQTIGTNWVETGRHSDKDGRLYGGVAWENGKGALVQPLIGVGSVSSERSDDLSGTLLDFLFEGAVPITSGAELRGFLRHQRPPGSEAFTTFAIALGFKVGWAGG